MLIWLYCKGKEPMKIGEKWKHRNYRWRKDNFYFGWFGIFRNKISETLSSENIITYYRVITGLISFSLQKSEENWSLMAV